MPYCYSWELLHPITIASPGTLSIWWICNQTPEKSLHSGLLSSQCEWEKSFYQYFLLAAAFSRISLLCIAPWLWEDSQKSKRRRGCSWKELPTPEWNTPPPWCFELYTISKVKIKNKSSYLKWRTIKAWKFKPDHRFYSRLKRASKFMLVPWQNPNKAVVSGCYLCSW